MTKEKNCVLGIPNNDDIPKVHLQYQKITIMKQTQKSPRNHKTL
jgi:hypothetical protein